MIGMTMETIQQVAGRHPLYVGHRHGKVGHEGREQHVEDRLEEESQEREDCRCGDCAGSAGGDTVEETENSLQKNLSGRRLIASDGAAVEPVSARERKMAL